LRHSVYNSSSSAGRKVVLSVDTHTVIYGATNIEEKLMNQPTKARRILSMTATFIC